MNKKQRIFWRNKKLL